MAVAKAEYLKDRLPWFKIFSRPLLRGKIRLEKPITRDVLFGLLALAADSPYENDDGTRDIKLTDGVGINDQQYCKILNISMEEWLFAKERLTKRESIKVNEETNIITILNWPKYQTLYQRTRKSQLKYRKRLRKWGAKNMGEAVVKSFAQVKSNMDSIYAVLKFLQPDLHNALEKNLNLLFPDGHEYEQAKAKYDELRKKK